MIWIIVLLVLALALSAASFVFFIGLPESRTPSGKRIKMTLGGLGLCVLLALGLGIAILVQEQTGVETGLSGGVESDARQWVSRNATSPPAPDQAGDNIRMLREGLQFINRHPSVAESPEAQNVVQQYSTLPATPTRLLTRQEESQYYEGARAVYRLIGNVANRDNQAAETQ